MNTDITKSKRFRLFVGTKSIKEIAAQLNKGMVELGLVKPDIRKALELNPQLIVRA